MAKQADSSEVFHFLNRDLIFWGLLIAGLMIPGGVWVLQMGEPLQFAVCCWGIGVGSLVMTARLERELVIDGRQLVTTRWCWRSGAIALNDVVSVEHGYDVTQGDVAKRFKRVCLVLADGKKIELNGVREGTDALYAALRRACEEARAMDTVKAEEEALKSHRSEFRGSMTLERVLSFTLYPLLLFGGTYLWAMVLMAASALYRNRPDVAVDLPPSLGFWIGWGFCLAWVSGTCVVAVLWGWLLKDRLNRWMAFGALWTHEDLRAKLRFSFLGGVVLSLGVLPGLDCYTQATSTKFVLNSFWSIGETQYDFERVRRIQVSYFRHDGRSIPSYEIEFDDGAVWASQSWIKTVNPETIGKHRTLAEFVAQKSGVRVQ